MSESLDVLNARVGLDYLRATAVHLAETLRADYVVISRLDSDAYEVSSLVFCADGKIESNQTYSLVGTPCENLLDCDGFVFEGKQVAELYPIDTILAELNLEAYAGSPLLGTVGQPYGTLIALFREERTDKDAIRSVFDQFSARIGAELQRQLAEDRIRASEVRFRSVFENVPDLVAVLSKNGTILQQNSALERGLGYSVRDWLGSKLLEWVHAEDVQPLCEIFEKLAERSIIEGSLMLRLRTSRSHWKIFEAKIRTSAQEEFVATFRDVTEREELKVKLADYEKHVSASAWTEDHSEDVSVILKKLATQIELLQRTSVFPADILKRIQDLRGTVGEGLKLVSGR